MRIRQRFAWGWVAGASIVGAGPAVATEPPPVPAQAAPAAPVPEDLASLPIEQLLDLRVSGASRFEQTRRDAPAAVVVLTADDFKAYGWRTLGDALASLAGLYTSYDRSYQNLGARGFMRPGDYSSRFLLLVDGVRVNDPLYDRAGVGTDFVLDTDLIDRVEYVPGPGSAVYGASAVFGVINVYTRRAAALDHAELALAGGDDGTWQARATTAATRAGGPAWMLSASRSVRDGRDLYFPAYDTPDQNDGIAEGLDGDRTTRAFAKLDWAGWSAYAAHADRRKETPTANYGQVFNDPHSQVRDRYTVASVARELAPDADLRLSARLSYVGYAYDGAYVYGQAPLTLNRDDVDASDWSLELQALSTAWSGHKLVAGTLLEALDRQQRNATDDAPPQVDDRRRKGRVGVYVEDEWRLSSRLLANLGLRFDYNGDTGERHWSPRGALIYSWSPRTTLKGILGSAYRLPNVYELYYQYEDQGQGQLANPDLGRERIRTAELVWEQRLGRASTATVSVYDYRMNDLITLVPDSASGLETYRNLDSASAHGIEFAYERRWRRSSLRASYALQDAHDSRRDVDLQNSPHQLAQLAVSAPIPATPLFAGLELRYVDDRVAQSGVEIDGYWLSNLRLSWPNLLPHTEASLTVFNVFDARYEDPVGPEIDAPGVEQDGRRWLGKLVVRF